MFGENTESSGKARKKSGDRVKGPWSPEEDAILSKLVANFGARNWSLIARVIPGRSGKSCRLRWCNQLDPAVKRKPFSGNHVLQFSFSLKQEIQVDKDSAAEEEFSEDAKVFIGNLSFAVDSTALAELFEQAGTVEIAEVIYNRETEQSRGFGFVTMSSVEEAEKAVELLNGYEFNGRALTVNKAAPKGSRPKRAPRSFETGNRIYVGNLPWDVDDSSLQQIFSEFGDVVNARVVCDRDTGRSRGFGFVTMSNKSELNDAISNLYGKVKLRVGDIVKCCIVKITFFGIFVKVEGVPALIHQTEVSWDSTLDPMMYFKIGQVVDAKVHQLDFSFERIFLSLKDLMPDPLIESIESVCADNGSLDERLEEVQPDSKWGEVETLIKELERVDGIESVSKGRYCLSPSLAPTFQVYMASIFENQYKLLARSENKVQEVIVQTSLSKEEMKFVIQTCTNRVS